MNVNIRRVTINLVYSAFMVYKRVVMATMKNLKSVFEEIGVLDNVNSIYIWKMFKCEKKPSTSVKYGTTSLLL